MRMRFILPLIAGAVALAAPATASDLPADAPVVLAAAKTKVGVPKQGQGAGHKVRVPGVSYATTTVKCDNATYEISTGSGSGACTGGSGPGSRRTCTDNKGNAASATCSGGCGETYGSGSCKAVAQ